VSVWFDGAWIVHLTGDNDPDADSLKHLAVFRCLHHNIGLLQRANLVISRGAGTLTELAVTGTPSILIPLPTAADDHQSYNAAVWGSKQQCFKQPELTSEVLQTRF